MDEKEFIEMTDMFFDIIMKNIINCNMALEILYENEDLPVDEKRYLILMAFYRELFERLISIKTLYHEKLIGSSNVVIRSFYEILLQLLFILFPAEKCNEKIGCSSVYFSYKKMVDTQAYIGRDAALKNSESWKNILSEKKKEYHKLQGVYVDIYKNKIENSDRKYGSWYSLFNKRIKNIPALANELDNMQLHEEFPKHWFANIYQKVYNYLSEFSHGITVLDAIHMTDNEIQINDIHNLMNASVGIVCIYKLIETYNACVSSLYPHLKFDTIDLIFLKKLAEQIGKLDKQQI